MRTAKRRAGRALLCSIFLAAGGPARAEQADGSSLLPYAPRRLYELTIPLGSHADLDLGQDDPLETLSLENAAAWQIIPAGRHVFFKPLEARAEARVSMLTQRRLYRFHLRAGVAAGGRPTSVAFKSEASDGFTGVRYDLRGGSRMGLAEVYDDGRFTYFKFNALPEPRPAFFLMERDVAPTRFNRGAVSETLTPVGFHPEGNDLVVERLGEKFMVVWGNEKAVAVKQSSARRR